MGSAVSQTIPFVVGVTGDSRRIGSRLRTGGGRAPGGPDRRWVPSTLAPVMSNWWASLPELTPGRRRALVRAGVIWAVIVWAIVVAASEPYDWDRPGTGHDARPYWTAIFEHPYATSRVGAHDAYLYSPAFLELTAPIRALPWQWFLACWTAVLILALLYVVGPVLLGPALVLVLPEIIGGNITLLMAATLVAGFRYPGAWAFPLLTKVTPGVGLLWFAVRREWRALAIATATTLGLVLLSFAYTPEAWDEWFRVLAGNAGTPIESGSLPTPLLVRLPIALIVITWAARTNRRWALPIGCLLALPVVWYGSLSLLVAIIPLAAPTWTASSWRDAVGPLGAWVRRQPKVSETQSA